MRQQSLSNKEWQLLSEYMDGQLSPRDKARLEQRLNEREDLRTALDELRRTRAVLRSVKLQRVPRNFTLTPAMLPQQRSNPFFSLAPILNFASVASVVALIIVLAVGLLPGLSAGGTLRTAQEAPSAMEAAPAQAPAAAGETPVIINWQAPYGLGGGGGEGQPKIMTDSAGSEPAPEGIMVAPPAAAGKGAPDVTEMPAEPAEETPPLQALPAPLLTATPAASGMPPAAPMPAATQEPEMTLQMAPTEPAAGSRSIPTDDPYSVSQAPLEGSQPLLGVRPADEAAAANQAAIDTAREQATAARPVRFPWVVPVILALIAVGSWVSARILRRKYGS